LSSSFHIPIERMFLNGYSRVENLYKESNFNKRNNVAINIIYAPTYRYDNDFGDRQMQMLIDAAEKINLFMSEANGFFTIRLHPHTWNKYKNSINNLTEKFDKIKIDTEKDVYLYLNKYDMMITDYSSIVYDYLLLDRPMIFFCPDVHEYIKNEIPLKYDYYDFSPGPKVLAWNEVLAAIKQYLIDPKKDSEFRSNIKDFFYESSVNDCNNSKRLVNELKIRLSV
jgi:CDP-glycerol glycerophosphotransferase